jgi:DNA topoisomerase-1
MLNPSSKLKGEKDMQKYETARRLHKRIGKIRDEYRQDWKHKEMRIRQRSVALYFIDKVFMSEHTNGKSSNMRCYSVGT